MIWLIYALIATLSASIRSIFHRFIMLTEDPYSYALLENILTAFIFIPVLINEFVFPLNITAWILVLTSSILWVFIAIVGFYAYKYTQVSLKSPLSESRVLWVLLFAIIFLKEKLIFDKIFGIILIFISLVILTYKKRKRFGDLSDKGVQLTLLTALLTAGVAIIDKSALQYFTAGTFGFLVYFIPGLILMGFGKKHFKDVKKILKTKHYYLGLVVILGFFFYYFKLKAYEIADVTQVFPIIRLSTAFTVIFGIIFLREKENIWKKIIATVIILFGVLLLSGNYGIFN